MLPKTHRVLEQLHLVHDRSASRQGWLALLLSINEQVATRFEGCDERVLLVDIRGARGQEMGGTEEKYPRSPVRCILQDLPDTIKRVQVLPGMEAMPYKFSMI